MAKKRKQFTQRHKISEEEKLERDLMSCMHCKYFWGHNNRCANGNCCKDTVKKKEIVPDKCKGCPYYKGNGYCFPCMKELLGK